MNIGVGKFRGRLRAILDRVEHGDPVTITVHGRPKMRLVRVDDTDDTTAPETPAAFGMWKDRENMQDVVAYVRDLRRDRHGRSTARSLPIRRSP